MNLKRAVSGFLLSFIFILLFGYIIYGFQYFLKYNSENQSQKIFLGSVSEGFNAAQGNLNQNNNIVQGLEISAASAISAESNLSGLEIYQNKILFEQSGDTKLPIASLTKLMTAVIVLDNYDLSKNITVDAAADSQDSIFNDVKLGDTMPAENFLEIMLVESSNKSAYALSEIMGEQKFVGLMNQKAKDIGLSNTFFTDPTGLSPEDVSTSEDLVKLAEYILKNYPRIAEISKTKYFYVPDFGGVTNTDQLLGELPDIVCSKTGFTDNAKGCLLLVLANPKNNDYIINIILGADDRFAEMKKLINLVNSTCN